MRRAIAAALAAGCAGGADVSTSSGAAGAVRLRVAEQPFVAVPGDRWFVRDFFALELDALEDDQGGRKAGIASAVGREDLIAAHDNDFQPAACALSEGGGDPLDAIAERAGHTRVVIVNESHRRTRSRRFSEQMVRRLAAEGFDTFAAETFANSEGDFVDGVPPVVAHAADAYPHLNDGSYSREAAFGRLVRTAKALGFKLVPYEIDIADLQRERDPFEQMAAREEIQAANLAAYLSAHPEAKMIVHVGYGHGSETMAGADTPPGLFMGGRLKLKSGIDPLTIDQTSCRGNAGGGEMAPAKQPDYGADDAYDLFVDAPVETYVRARPAWRLSAGDRAVDIPSALLAGEGWRVIEARLEGEPAEAVPMDTVAVRPGEDVALMLPPGDYWVRALVREE